MSVFRNIDEGDAARLLGLQRRVPMTPEEMAAGLRVSFFPVQKASDRVRRFAHLLKEALLETGVSVLEQAEAMDPARPRKYRENLVVIAAGEMETGNLPVDYVQNLRTTTVVGIVDGPCPTEQETTDQEKLNQIVRTLTWSIVQVAIYVDDEHWTITTMNGAVIPCSLRAPIGGDVLQTLVPKLAAPVVPPHAADFDIRAGVVDLADPELHPYVDDFVRSGTVWSQTGLLLFHTSMEDLEFRNPFYRRVAAAYLDHRSGMSYGFLARQPAQVYQPPWFEGGDSVEVTLRLADGVVHIPVPDVWMLTTRSGCDKSNIDASRDLMLMGLSAGRAIVATPRGLAAGIDSRPSYDTLTILAHGLANCLAASVLEILRPDSYFPRMMRSGGAALAHWHGMVSTEATPEGYAVHGSVNPPVSCSTYQAALFALCGKLGALDRMLREGGEFRGDIHVEPHHGVNVTGPSLLSLARWAKEAVAIDDSSRKAAVQ